MATVHVPTAHSKRPLSQDSLSVLLGTFGRDIRHVWDHVPRDNRAGVLQNPGMSVTRKVSHGRQSRGTADHDRIATTRKISRQQRDRIHDVSLNRTVESSN